MKERILKYIRALMIKCGVNNRIFMHDKDFIKSIAADLIRQPKIFGDEARLSVGRDVVLNDALINLSSGNVVIGNYVFTGHGVSLLTGTHDINKKCRDRQLAVPYIGRDIIIHDGVWIATNATIIGPCTIGENSVIAAGAVVVGDVPSNVVYAGVPAVKIHNINYG